MRISALAGSKRQSRFGRTATRRMGEPQQQPRMLAHDRTIQHLGGFASLANIFDGFILDLWGVIHDGAQPLPGAVDCLRRLKAMGKRVVLLSNVPRPHADVQADMRAMGIGDGLYTAMLTSGDAVRCALLDRPDQWWAALGESVFHLGPERNTKVMDGLRLTRVTSPAQAEFVLATGPIDQLDPADLSKHEPVLQDCARHHLPMVCPNPDLEAICGGRREICAGALAQRYLELGGDVRWVGKPDPAIYWSALKMLDLQPERVLAVGDALRTDIAGGAGMGLATCWVLGGIHGDELGGDPELAQAAAREAGLSPLACIPRFTWWPSSGQHKSLPQQDRRASLDSHRPPRLVVRGHAIRLQREEPGLPKKAAHLSRKMLSGEYRRRLMHRRQETSMVEPERSLET